jgi:hypothetical protein
MGNDPVSTAAGFDGIRFRGGRHAQHADPVLLALRASEDYAKLFLKKYRPIAARNDEVKVFSGLL